MNPTVHIRPFQTIMGTEVFRVILGFYGVEHVINSFPSRGEAFPVAADLARLFECDICHEGLTMTIQLEDPAAKEVVGEN